MQLKGHDYGEMNWHPERAPIKLNGPTCTNCKRPLIVVEAKCLCCTSKVTQ
jgi:hypothetical protein